MRTLPFLGKHDKQQCIYWDAALEGFGTRVYRSGHRMYVCSYRIGGRKRLGRLGRVDVLSLEVARKKAISYLGKVASNEDPQIAKESSGKLLSVAELCTLYIEGHAKRKKKTWKGDESLLRRLVVAKLKHRLAITIVPADLEPIHAQMGVAHPYAANRILTTYRKLVNWAKVAGYLPKDYASPIVGIVRFPERTRKRFVTTVEMPRLLAALEQEFNDFARHGIWLLLLTGMRGIELRSAQWSHVDWDMGTLFIGLTKNGDPLLAPLSDAAIARLKVIPRISGNPYILCGKISGRPLSGLGEALKRALRKAKLENIHIHDLRRTVGSWLAQNGTSLHLIGDVLNHRDAKTTAGYAYFQTQQRREALSSHADKVLAFAGPGMRLPLAPEESSAQTLLVDNNPVGSTTPSIGAKPVHYFKRENLYELVWTAPVLEVAKRLGVSDVAVGKLCRRAGVPVPCRGYWAKVDAGQIVSRTPLGPQPQGLPELLRIRGG